MRLEHTFTTLRDFGSFIFARKFYYADGLGLYPPGKVEQIAQKLLAPLQEPLDKLVRNIYSPPLIAALNVVAVGAVTVFIYPQESFTVLQTLAEPFLHLEPHMFRLLGYLCTEAALTNLMIRTIARLNDTELLKAWEERRVLPLHLGAVPITGTQ